MIYIKIILYLDVIFRFNDKVVSLKSLCADNNWISLRSIINIMCSIKI